MNIPRVDNFEASLLTAPRAICEGDRVAVGWSEAHRVLDVRPTPSGAYIDLQGASGIYTIHRRSALPIVKR